MKTTNAKILKFHTELSSVNFENAEHAHTTFRGFSAKFKATAKEIAKETGTELISTQIGYFSFGAKLRRADGTIFKIVIDNVRCFNTEDTLCRTEDQRGKLTSNWEQVPFLEIPSFIKNYQ